jgi:hypothetical protein
MNEIVESVISPVWWFSTIIIAVLVNIFSAYAKPVVDNVFSKTSTAWRNRTEKQAKKFSEDVTKLANSPLALEEASEKEVRARLEEISFTLGEIFLIIVINGLPSKMVKYSSDWILVNLLSFILLLGLYRMVVAWNEANYLASLIRAARLKINNSNI